ncbi:MAG: VOC family protein [Alphaproteobacteria bacterium]|nr:VOC family protein [Alphaproteobacteria bacterium]
MPDITPFLWFDHQAEEAAEFYVSLFPDSKITKIVRNSGAAPGPKGAVLTVGFELDGKRFTALNGGPHFTFSEAVSFVIHCEDQAEIDYYWNALCIQGEGQCGWAKDRYGLSWQIVPAELPELIAGPKANAVMAEVMKMKKLDLAAMRKAAQS